MSDSNKGIFLAIGGAVVLALAAGAVYLLVLGPRSEKRRLQNEIDRWGVTWESARDCLVGPDPRSADGYEAVLLREALSPEDVVAELKECSEEILALRRGEGYSAGELEADWQEAQKKVTALAEAHAWRVGESPGRPVGELRAALASAVAALDAAYARLRDKADMDAATPDGGRLPTLPAGRVLADARGTPIVPEDIGVSGHVVWAVGSIADRRWLVRDAGAGAPQVIPIGAETVAGLDGGDWGVWSEQAEEGGPAEVRSGPVDPVGDPAGDGALIARLAPRETAAVRLALAIEPVRVAVFQTFDEAKGAGAAWLARSRDGGATWPERTALVRYGEDHTGSFQVTMDLGLQRADLFFPGADGAQRWLVLDPASAARPLAPARVETPAVAPCAAGERTWWLGDDDTIYTSEAAGKPLRPVPGSSEGAHTLVCAGERVVAITDAGDPAAAGEKVLVCRPSGCSATSIPAAAGSRAVAALGDRRGPLVATDAGGLAVVWSGDPEKKQAFQPVEIARLAGGQQLAGMVEWNGAIHLVTRTDKSLHIVPLGK